MATPVKVVKASRGLLGRMRMRTRVKTRQRQRRKHYGERWTMRTRMSED
jgi:hypothetical protein